MVIVGLSPVAHNSAVSLLMDGKLVAAAAEERFTRVKNDGGFPHRALQYVLREAGISARDVTTVAYAALPFTKERMRDLGAYVYNLAYVARTPGSAVGRLLHVANSTRGLLRQTELLRWGASQRRIREQLAKYGLAEKLVFIDHHRSHCASAYYTSGFDRCLALSLDGYGSGHAGAVYVCEGGQMRLLAEIPYLHSLGTFYRRVTQALGFEPNRHEGKVVGLAAHGDPGKLGPIIRRRFDLSHPDYFRIPAGQDPLFDRKLASKHRREDVAAAYQQVLEEVVERYTGIWVKRTGVSRIACAGGVFANVKMNQRVAALPSVKEIFVFPAMGDDGVGAGAAYAHHAATHGLEPQRLDDVYLGPGYTESHMERALRTAGLPFERQANAEEGIVDALTDNQVVARFSGRMEFGPRALGNRSLLYPASDPSVNQWLNKRLKRTEFMPFAPLTLASHAAEVYEDAEKIRYTAEFMTVTAKCTAQMREQSPAAVHVDGTARPQLVTSESNPSLWRVLNLYRERTGIPSLINTSFNMHEEPIVCTPEDAIRAFQEGELEVLAMGPFIVRRPPQDHLKRPAPPGSSAQRAPASLQISR